VAKRVKKKRLSAKLMDAIEVMPRGRGEKELAAMGARIERAIAGTEIAEWDSDSLYWIGAYHSMVARGMHWREVVDLRGLSGKEERRMKAERVRVQNVHWRKAEKYFRAAMAGASEVSRAEVALDYAQILSIQERESDRGMRRRLMERVLRVNVGIGSEAAKLLSADLFDTREGEKGVEWLERAALLYQGIARGLFERLAVDRKDQRTREDWLVDDVIVRRVTKKRK
jgi:hypothetical protein